MLQGRRFPVDEGKVKILMLHDLALKEISGELNEISEQDLGRRELYRAVRIDIDLPRAAGDHAQFRIIEGEIEVALLTFLIRQCVLDGHRQLTVSVTINVDHRASS